MQRISSEYFNNTQCNIGFLWSTFIISRHTIVAEYYGNTLAVRVSVRPSVCRTSVRPYFRFWTSKCQWIFTKIGVCIDIMDIWFGIVNEHISSFFDSYLPATAPYFHFRMITLVNINGFSPNLICALIL